MQIEQALLKVDRYLLQLWRKHDQSTDIGNLSWNEYHYVDALRDGPLRLSDLATRIGVQKASASTMTRKLEQRGLVSRKNDPSDGRAILLQLTPRAIELLSLESLVYSEFVQDLRQRMEPSELKQLQHLFIRAAQVLTQSRQSSLKK